MFRTVSIFTLALAAMTLTPACSVIKRAAGSSAIYAQSPKDSKAPSNKDTTVSSPGDNNAHSAVEAEKLYDQLDQAYANHDVKKLLSFYDPSFTLIDEKDKQIGFEEYSKNQTSYFENPNLKNFNKKTIIKDVQMESGRMVVYNENQLRYSYLRVPAYGWEVWINLGTSETTWQKTSGQWKIVQTHVLKISTGIDPQWYAMQRQADQNKLNAIRRASSVLVPCNMSYNGCR